MGFNNASIAKNVLKASIVSVIANLFTIVVGFTYRMFFLKYLSVNYLGINGLFSSILMVLSLAELGFSSAISYRLYKPISENDTYNVGRLMNFYKKVFRYVAISILFAGLLLMPFIKYFIKTTSEIPADINLYFIYFLNIIQTVSSYLYAYKQALYAADQKQYKLYIFSALENFVINIVQLLILFLWKNYTLTLVASIIIYLVANYIFGLIISSQYKEVFFVKDELSMEERKQIIDDTKASMSHKIGNVVLTSTDSIVITKFIGLSATGLMNNYQIIFNYTLKIASQIFSSFTASIGKIHFVMNTFDKKQIYNLLNLINYWFAGFVTVCLFILSNSFIEIWIGKEMLLSSTIVGLYSIQIFLELSKVVTNSYIMASGLFVKDRIRPIIEASINIVISVYLSIRIGIAGVIIGTIVSHLLTSTWREPYILYKYEFKDSLNDYWFLFVKIICIVTLSSIIIFFMSNIVSSTNHILNLFLLLMLSIFVYNILFIIVFRNNDSYIYLKKNLFRIIKEVIH